MPVLTPGQIQKVRGEISVKFIRQSDYGFTTVKEMKYTSQAHNASVTKQWMTKWPCIANDVFRIVHNHGK